MESLLGLQGTGPLKATGCPQGGDHQEPRAVCWMTAPAGAETSPTAHPQGLGKHGFPNTGDLSSPQATRTRRGTDRVPTPHSARARRPPRTASPSGSWSRGTALQSLLPLAVQGKDQHSPERCSADTRRPNPRGPTPRPHSLPDVSDVLVADRVQRAFVQPVRAEGPRGGRGGTFHILSSSCRLAPLPGRPATEGGTSVR